MATSFGLCRPSSGQNIYKNLNAVYTMYFSSMSWDPIYNRIVLYNTSQQDFGTRKVYCVSIVTFHAESKYAIKIFPSPTVFVQWPF